MADAGSGGASAAAARALVDALAASGVTDACITPGSRSTPLTAAFARHGGVKPWLHLDERSSAFFALGLAREQGRPVALVCTSGTAAANYLPAVVEANLSRVPLVVLTADRPPRLRDIGAEQTIAQVGMFGPNVRWTQDLQVPTGREDEPRYLRAAALRAVQTAVAPLPGPVHLNLPYEEPLIDAGKQDPPPGAEGTARAMPVRLSRLAPGEAEIAHAAALLSGASGPLIVAGPETGGLPAEPIARLAAALDAPILADPLSGLRCGAHDRSHIADAYDAVLRDERANGEMPDVVIRFGGVPTSKALNLFLARAGAASLLVDAHLSWRDPSATATAVIVGDAGLVAEVLAELVSPGGEGAQEWCGRWLERDRRARAAMDRAACGFEAPFEGRVITELQRALPDGARVLVGNSMPVRDLDAFFAARAQVVTFNGNRGANGIDGVVSSALGMAAADGGPSYLVIGDLSFYHDLNGLWAAKRHGLNLTIILVNNDGGGIFHYLPQAAYPEVFEEWFGTPSGLDFAPAVAMYGGTHTVAADWQAFARAVAEPPEGLRVIEVRTDRMVNAGMHREAWAAAGEAAWGGTAL